MTRRIKIDGEAKLHVIELHERGFAIEKIALAMKVSTTAVRTALGKTQKKPKKATVSKPQPPPTELRGDSTRCAACGGQTVFSSGKYVCRPCYIKWEIETLGPLPKNSSYPPKD